MVVDTTRYAQLRELRKTGDLTREEHDEWQVLDAQRQIDKARRRQQIARDRTNKRLVARKVELGGILVETGLENDEPQQIRRIIAAGKAAINAGPEADTDDAEQLARVIHIGILADQAGLANLPDDRLQKAFKYCAGLIQKERETTPEQKTAAEQKNDNNHDAGQTQN